MRYARTIHRLLTLLPLLLLTSGGGGGCQSLANFVHAQHPTARVTAMSLQLDTPSSGDLVFDIHVTNPYEVALPVSHMDYALTSSGKTFLTGRIALSGSVPAHDGLDLRIPVNLNYVNLYAELPDAKPGGTIAVDAELAITFNAPAVGPMRVPMDRTGDITLPGP